MHNLSELVSIADEFDRLGHIDLANKLDALFRIGSEVKINNDSILDRPYNKEEEQRCIAIEYDHLYTMYIDRIPQIEYLTPFWDVIKSALDHFRMLLRSIMKDKTKAFNFIAFRERFQKIIEVREKLKTWIPHQVGKPRVLAERQLLLSPLKDIARRLSRLFQDDEEMQMLQTELERLVNVFDNIFEQTTSEIANFHFKRGL